MTLAPELSTNTRWGNCHPEQHSLKKSFIYHTIPQWNCEGDGWAPWYRPHFFEVLGKISILDPPFSRFQRRKISILDFRSPFFKILRKKVNFRPPSQAYLPTHPTLPDPPTQPPRSTLQLPARVGWQRWLITPCWTQLGRTQITKFMEPTWG